MIGAQSVEPDREWNEVAAIPRKRYKIGEVMEHSGLSRQTVHYYTVLGLIRPEGRTPSGHRLYAEDAFERLERIAELKRDHTLEEIRDLLEQEAARSSKRKSKK